MASVPDEKNVNSDMPGGVTSSSASRARTLAGVAKSWTLSSSAAARPIASAIARVGVADVGDDDAAGEVEVAVAVDVGKRDAVARLVGDGMELDHLGDAAGGVPLHSRVPHL